MLTVTVSLRELLDCDLKVPTGGVGKGSDTKR